ncbi:phospholipase C [Granulicella sibirica]|uniref:Acid phosphatase n=1 Tax=Granulicella sibirica TaxID=2479048 RepID=A0A4Q0SZ91_9BACT|nr:alkaline phosphatase family protein [Granulicella sibirica]RXH55330.1 Acid phosphatase [Granulicella sibirica]
MRKYIALSLSAALVLSGCSSGTSTTTTTTTTPPAATLTPVTSSQVIKHVVVIFGENISFDHYFATYPTATNPAGENAFTAASGTPTPAGLSGTLLTANPNSTQTANGAAATNPFRLDVSQAATADQDHNYGPEQAAFNNGAMDKFPLSVGTPDSAALAKATGASAIAATNGLTMGYYDGNTVTGLWNYAQHYALNDHSFSTTFGPSTPGAINLVSGQTNGVINDIGSAADVVSDGTATGLTLVSDSDPTGDVCSSASASVHMTGRNVGDLLSAANVSWGFFEGGFDLTVTNADGSTGCGRTTTSAVTTTKKADYIPHHEPFQYYASTANLTHVRPTSAAAIGTNADAANHQYDTHDFTDALAAGNLPAVSFLKAPGFQDAHAGYSDPIDEQAFVVTMVNAIEKSSFWPNTAIILAYDDSDGWYDHMINIVNGSQSAQDALVSAGVCSSATASSTTALPGVDGVVLHAQGRCGYGTRMPLMVLSPWAKKNSVDSTVTDQSSITRFIEDTFVSSQRLGGGSFDSIAGPLTGMFDFTNNVAPNPNVVVLDPKTGLVTSGN